MMVQHKLPFLVVCVCKHTVVRIAALNLHFIIRLKSATINYFKLQTLAGSSTHTIYERNGIRNYLHLFYGYI